jgi:hypothetical protein
MSIAQTIQHARNHGAHRPFGAAPMTKTAAKPTDPDTLLICDDPLPTSRLHAGKKYEPTFERMRLGQSINCASDQVGHVSGAMRKFVQVRKLQAVVRTVKNYGDGRGRVWMLADKPVK